MNKFNNYYKKILNEEMDEMPMNGKPKIHTVKKTTLPLPPIPEEGIKELLNAEDDLCIRVYNNSEDFEDGIENDNKSVALDMSEVENSEEELKFEINHWLKSLKLTGKYFIRLTRNRSDGDEVIVEYDPGMTNWDVSINR